jgi:NAD+ kinase
VKKIGLVVKPADEAIATAKALGNWLTHRNIQVVFKDGSKSCRMQLAPPKCPLPSDLDAVFVLGGDGTFLSAVRWIGDQSIPVIGIKFGEVGFLAEITAENLYSAAKAILDHRYAIYPRMRLLVRVFKDEKEIARETVLNDLVINKGALARLALINTHINDRFLTAYRADGLIIATPTGSTAYSLAAGGPIIHPSVPGILLSPICPFTLTNRPLMVPENATIKMQLAEKTTDIRLTCDGQVGMEIDESHTIIVVKGRFPVQMITLPDQDYFDLLKAKLKWSGGRI